MAEEIYFLTRNYAYDPDVAISTPGTSEGTNLPPLAIDRQKASYWETADSVPAQLAIDLLSAQNITGLWFKHNNVSKYELYRSSDGVAYTQVGTEQTAQSTTVGYWILVPSTTYRYYRLDITEKVGGGNILIHELMLMKHLYTLDHNNPERYPARINRRKVDRIGGTYKMFDGKQGSYSGDRLFEEITFAYQYAPVEVRNQWYALYYEENSGKATIRQAITIFPEPDQFPEEILQGIWKSPVFPFTATTSYRSSGYSGTIEFGET